ncbi:Phosphonates-binding periplasmic protein [Desulfonema magnum]|uniref:Phosphonates-binding periplasmic protein n=2 Tax=Desulfonema magnum TaxID=45655 RepID=A0A975BQU2_9BACT|nr:Phosphonates-binding periplasmic protein [Desulfonema magnum]
MNIMRKRLKILCVALFLTLLSLPVTVRAEQKHLKTTIRLGLIPRQDRDIVTLFQPVLEHLKQCLGTEIKAYSSDNYEGIIRALAHQQVDFAYLGPKSYVEATEKIEVEALVSEMNKQGEPGYCGVIIAKKGNGIEDIEQAKNKIFAFTEPYSTSGYLVPGVAFARDIRIDPKTYFKSVQFSGSHKASILGVKNGSIDVAATNTIDLLTLKEGGKISDEDFIILWKSELIPGSPICARKSLPESLKQSFRSAMTGFKNKKALERIGIGGFILAEDKDYDIIRELSRMKKKLSAK